MLEPGAVKVARRVLRGPRCSNAPGLPDSTFATVRLRTKVTKGPGSRAAGLAMAYKLIEAAQTREQRCWVHVTANVLNALPKSAQPAARRALAEIRDAADRAHAEAAIKAFADAFGAKWPKAVAKIVDKPDELLAFFDFPAEHWIHLKTTNPIEVRHEGARCEQLCRQEGRLMTVA